jgi:hypothetical protein
VNLDQLREFVVRPTLQYIELWSHGAENLVLGTALVESKAEYIHQVRGPALGLWQMEPATHDDIWDNYLSHPSREQLREWVRSLQTESVITDGAREMIGNLYYGAAMCRIHYRRSPRKIPDAKDAQGMAEMWKAFYNTARGAGTVAKALPHFIVACAA